MRSRIFNPPTAKPSWELDAALPTAAGVCATGDVALADACRKHISWRWASDHSPRAAGGQLKFERVWWEGEGVRSFVSSVICHELH